MLWEFIYRFLGNTTTSSRIHARERLRLVLVHDRAKISPFFMNRLKEDLAEVISKYMLINEEGMEVTLDQSKGEVTLKTSIPVKKIKRNCMNKVKSTL